MELHDLCCCGDKIKKDRFGGWGVWQVRRERMCIEGFVVKPEGRRSFG